MELNQIRYFLNLAETLNFTAAARLSGISQPSLTRAIQRLEEELGAPLIYCDGKHTRLTTLGREMQVEFMRICGHMGRVRDLAENFLAGHRRVLSIGVASTISPRAFGQFIRHVLKRLPAVELQIHPMQPGEDESDLLSGKYVLCILTAPPAQNGKLSIVPLFTERLLLAIGRNHPLAPAAVVIPRGIGNDLGIPLGNFPSHCCIWEISETFNGRMCQHLRPLVLRSRSLPPSHIWTGSIASSGRNSSSTSWIATSSCGRASSRNGKTGSNPWWPAAPASVHCRPGPQSSRASF